MGMATSVVGKPGQYAPYQIVLSNGLLNRPLNDNVLGAPAVVRSATNPPATNPTATEFASAKTVAGNNASTNVPAQGFFLLGPPTPAGADFRDPFVPASTIPGTTPVIRAPGLAYKLNIPVGGTGTEAVTGLTVLLRRLANPHIPYDPNPTVAGSGAPNVWYNPYVTVDYLDSVRIWDGKSVAAGGSYISRGKKQPYASRTVLGTAGDPKTVTADSPVADQTTADAGTNVQHTFGQRNVPGPLNNNTYDWLVHLDRQLISPVELLHVSGFQPHQLTQQFMLKDIDATGRGANAPLLFAHRAPWLDERFRLYRLFELLQTHEFATGNSTTNGRVAGKININSIWDVETLQAVCDVNTSNYVSLPTDVQAMFTLMLSQRSPGVNGIICPGPTDSRDITVPNPAGGTPVLMKANRPFLSMATGYTAAGDTQFPGGRGINDTLLRSGTTGGGSTFPRLFQKSTDNGAVHPYQQYQLLTKIYNRLTTRSNVFAVWVTVGFFEVTNPNASPPTLGAEIGRAEGRQVRHRMFAIVDRSRLTKAVAPPGRFNARGNTNLVPHFSVID
jgi:hypothetical protein